MKSSFTFYFFPQFLYEFRSDVKFFETFVSIRFRLLIFNDSYRIILCRTETLHKLITIFSNRNDGDVFGFRPISRDFYKHFVWCYTTVTLLLCSIERPKCIPGFSRESSCRGFIFNSNEHDNIGLRSDFDSENLVSTVNFASRDKKMYSKNGYGTNVYPYVKLVIHSKNNNRDGNDKHDEIWI